MKRFAPVVAGAFLAASVPAAQTGEGIMARGTRRLGLVVVVILALVLSGCAFSPEEQIGLGVGMIVGGAIVMESAGSALEESDAPLMGGASMLYFLGALGGAALIGAGGLVTLYGINGLYELDSEGEPQLWEAPLERRRGPWERRRWKDQTHLFVTPNGAAVTYRF